MNYPNEYDIIAFIKKYYAIIENIKTLKIKKKGPNCY